jgi:hypothetical protein
VAVKSMTGVMLDALNPAGIPLTIPVSTLVASYVPPPASRANRMTLLAQRFPHNPHVTITATGAVAHIADVEFGAMTPQDVPAWCTRMRALGIDPIVYATARNWTLVTRTCDNLKIAWPWWWSAQWGDSTYLPAGAIANQWADHGGYDESLVTDQGMEILMSQPVTAAQIAAGVETVTGNYYQAPPGVNWVQWIGDMRGEITEALAAINARLDTIEAAPKP